MAHAICVYRLHVLAEPAAFVQYPLRAYHLPVASAIAHAGEPAFFIIYTTARGVGKYVVGLAYLLEVSGRKSIIIFVGMISECEPPVRSFNILLRGCRRNFQDLIVILEALHKLATKIGHLRQP